MISCFLLSYLIRGMVHPDFFCSACYWSLSTSPSMTGLVFCALHMHTICGTHVLLYHIVLLPSCVQTPRTTHANATCLCFCVHYSIAFIVSTSFGGSVHNPSCISICICRYIYICMYISRISTLTTIFHNVASKYNSTFAFLVLCLQFGILQMTDVHQ